MAKTQNMTYGTQVLILVVLALVVGYLLTMSKSPKTMLKEPTTENSINKPDDLYQAQDEMNSVNIDSPDNGLNQLKTEVSTY